MGAANLHLNELNPQIILSQLLNWEPCIESGPSMQAPRKLQSMSRTLKGQLAQRAAAANKQLNWTINALTCELARRQKVMSSCKPAQALEATSLVGQVASSKRQIAAKNWQRFFGQQWLVSCWLTTSSSI